MTNHVCRLCRVNSDYFVEIIGHSRYVMIKSGQLHSMHLLENLLMLHGIIESRGITINDLPTTSIITPGQSFELVCDKECKTKLVL